MKGLQYSNVQIKTVSYHEYNEGHFQWRIHASNEEGERKTKTIAKLNSSKKISKNVNSHL